MKKVFELYFLFINKIFNSLLLSLITFITFYIKDIKIKYNRSLILYKNYIKFCSKFKKINRIRIKNSFPYVSFCLPCYNMEKYIRKVFYSIINQSFQDFEIIIVNDFSTDKTEMIVKELEKKEDRIKIINHQKNLGLYASRIDGILHSKGKYIILIDPDDMLLDPNLLEKIYKYNIKYNLDIIEYKVYHFYEKTGILELNINSNNNHYHKFNNDIIYQPELSNLFYYDSQNKNYSVVQCRTIWNKIIKKDVLLKAINYIGESYYKKFIITADDTLMSLISIHFAKNYSNIDLPGYMYNIRETSMTHGNRNKQKQKLFYYNYLLYFIKLYELIKDFNKDRNFLFYELKPLYYMLSVLKKDDQKYEHEINEFNKNILNDKYASIEFKNFIRYNVSNFK